MTAAETTGLLALMLLAAIVGAALLGRVRLPHIVGYILAGLALQLALLAMEGWGVDLAGRMLGESEATKFLKQFSLTVVMFAIGLAFESRQLRRLGRSFIWVGMVQAAAAFALTFAACAIVGLVGGADRPFVTAALLGAVAVAISPAATLLTLRQYEAKGRTSEDILAITGLSAVIAIFLFEIFLVVFGETNLVTLKGGATGPAIAVLNAVAATGGSILIGALAGIVLSAMHGRAGLNEELLALLAILLGVIALAGALYLDYLLTSLVAGIVFINIAHDPGRLEERLRVVAAPLLALLFVLSGFEMHLEAFASGAVVALAGAYILARGAGKIGGAYLAVRRLPSSGDIRPNIGLGLVCHAGIAIGLLSRLTDSAVEAAWINNFAAALLAAVAIFELAGPLLLKHTVVSAGEVKAFRLFHAPSQMDGGWGQLRDAIGSLLRKLGLARLPAAHEGPILARHVMHTNVKVLQGGAGLDDVLHFIERSHVDHFPVVGGDGRFMGTISLDEVRDIIYEPDIRKLIAAADMLEDDLVTAGPDETLAELFEKFKAHRAADLIVLDEKSQRILGIVEQRDVIRAMDVEHTGRHGQ